MSRRIEELAVNIFKFVIKKIEFKRSSKSACTEFRNRERYFKEKSGNVGKFDFSLHEGRLQSTNEENRKQNVYIINYLNFLIRIPEEELNEIKCIKADSEKLLQLLLKIKEDNFILKKEMADVDVTTMERKYEFVENIFLNT